MSCTTSIIHEQMPRCLNPAPARAQTPPLHHTSLVFAFLPLSIRHGPNGLRVRASPPGQPIRDDLVSAVRRDYKFCGAALPWVRGSQLTTSPPCGQMQVSAFAPLPAEGRAVAEQPCDGEPTSVQNGNLRAAVDIEGRLAFTRLSDGQTLLRETVPRVFSPTGTPPKNMPGFYTLDLQFAAVDGERIYGLGQHKTGKLDNKGVKGLRLQPQNTEVLIPVAHSSLGFTFLFNLPAFGTVEYNDTGSFWHADAVLQADFWVATTADSPPHASSPWGQLLSAYANVTGHAPVYPEWASGFWQCKNRYHNQSQLLDIAHGHRERGIPLSLLIIDYYSWAPLPLGDEQMSPACWPDPKTMVGMGGVVMSMAPWAPLLPLCPSHRPHHVAQTCCLHYPGDSSPSPPARRPL